jgi:hypothetical protein
MILIYIKYYLKDILIQIRIQMNKLIKNYFNNKTIITFLNITNHLINN